eukprot:TRINITY_DN9388_c0_g1_i2.p1 TRINITY_DN9388_c0_g1~~TRINITY_DN9388_c0_g1_i2.p1  ORF type:complete len:147 (+),score=30.07 TRINITY_DN9388_c0_g1_i2:229-669(+)
MKKDLQWTKNNEQGQETNDNDTDNYKRQRTQKTDKRQTFGESKDKRLLTIENDYSIQDNLLLETNEETVYKGQKTQKNADSQQDNENEHGKEDKDNKKVQNTITDSRHVSLLKDEIKTNSNVISDIRFIGTESKERTLEHLKFYWH